MVIRTSNFKKYLWVIVLLIGTAACGDKEYKTTHAKIVERRDVGNGKIRLSYIFKAGQTTIAGVKTVDNILITSDSCEVEYKLSNPLENNLKLH